MGIKETIKKYPTGLIGRAYALAERAHAKQKRNTGEPYFSHALAAAEILNQWKLDEATIAAGLLHDVVEDTAITLETIKKEFGEDVAFLVNGVTKLSHIKYRGAEEKVENLRKMILALSQDLRVIFIKLADRLHNMRTLGAIPREKQKRIALETDEIYAPIAYRLGMQNLSGELHDLAFPYLFPKEYEWLKKTVPDAYEARLKYLKKFKGVTAGIFHENGLEPSTIDLRAKRYASLYRKLQRYNMDLEKIYDLVAVRIITKTVAECYAVLGIIHKYWPPLPGRIKDYIALPKSNNYRSLHTTVIGPEGKFIEFQIRTKEMHEENENGIAAHWMYEQSKNRPGNATDAFKKMAKEITWVQQLRNWLSWSGTAQKNPEEFLKSMKIDFFKDRIFAITPKGDVIDLPAGATPVDFAYQIHSDIGNACVGAKVNGEFIAMDHKIQSGDLVEIITQKGKRPSEDWLGFVTTSTARDHIRAAIKEKDALRETKRIPTKTELRIVMTDRVGLLKDITSVIARSHVNILNIHTSNSSSRFHIGKIQCTTTDKQKIEKLILKLKKIKEIKEISYQIL